MTRLKIILLALVPATVFGAVTPVQPDASRRLPPPGVAISSEERKELEAGVAKLGQTIEALRGALRDNPALLRLLPDVQIYHKAVDWALRYDEFFNPTNEVRAAKALLRQGVERAQQLRDGQPAWTSATGLVVRAYVSKIDGSIQPYGLVVPASFQPTRPPLLTSHPHRLDIWLHGRDEKLTELKFINDRQRSAGEFTPSNAIVLHPYGRYCNAFKFAGEIDVLEAMDHVTKSYPIDTNRIVLRGFSMGGAGCWHLAAHYPGLWVAAAPGAGFAETPEYMKALERNPPPPWYEQKLWHLYNATDYAANFFNLPVVAYSGEIDKQKQAADIMAKAMAVEGLQLTHIIGPQTAHRYHPEAKKEVSRRIDEIATRGRDPLPRKIRFTTSTLRYNQNSWLRVERLEKHWEQARVEAESDGENSISIKTTNVSALTLWLGAELLSKRAEQPSRITIDGRWVATRLEGKTLPVENHFYKSENGWAQGVDSDFDGHRFDKRHGLQGPIDDAFMDSFIMVKPTGKPLNEKVGAWVTTEMNRAVDQWRAQFRGEARVKNDVDVTDADIEANNLILWGDPTSNQLLRRIARLPIAWSQTSIAADLSPHSPDIPPYLPSSASPPLRPHRYSSDHHALILIYPNPLNRKRYIVLNSGFTFRGFGSNADQTPKLPDFAIVDLNTPPSTLAPGRIVEAGFFGEQWESPARQRAARGLSPE